MGFPPKGHKKSKEHKEKIRQSLLGKAHSPERIARMKLGRALYLKEISEGKRIHHRKGAKLSRETRKKIAERKNTANGSLNGNWNPNREKVMMNVLMRRTAQNFIGRVILRLGTKKSGHTYEMLGYSAEELQERIETQFKPGMTWKNRGRGKGKWQIDHIKPIDDWPEGSTPDQVNALENLQPLWHEEHAQKTQIDRQRQRKGFADK